MSRKKIVSLLLAALMVVGWTAGCAKEKEAKNVGETGSAADAKPMAIKYLHGYHSNIDTMTKSGRGPEQKPHCPGA